MIPQQWALYHSINDENFVPIQPHAVSKLIQFPNPLVWPNHYVNWASTIIFPQQNDTNGRISHQVAARDENNKQVGVEFQIYNLSDNILNHVYVRTLQFGF